MIIYNVRVFASQLGWRLGALFFMLLLAGAAEGFGISLILPLLQSDIQESNDTLSKIIVWMFDILALSPTVTNILVMLVVFFSFRAVMLIAQSWYQAVLLSNHLTRMRSDLIRLVLNSRYQHLSKYPSGYLTNAIVGEARVVGSGMRSLIDLLVSFVTVAVYITLPLLLQPAVTLMLLVLAVPIVILSAVLIRKTKTVSIQLSEQHARQESSLIEAFRNAKFVKATGRVSTIIDRLIGVATQVSLSYRRLMILNSLTRYAPEPLVVLVMSGIILLYTNVYDEPITSIMFLMFLFYQASKNMLKMQSTLRNFIETSGSLKVHQKLRTELAENAVPDDSDKPHANVESEIALEGITVQFPNQDKPALDNVSLKVPHQQTVALVGASGSGKTTIANLICGLIEPSLGSLSIGGQPYSSISVSNLQKQIGYVTQESAVYNGTLGDNVTFWDEHPDAGKLAALLKQLELYDLNDGDSDPANRQVGGDGAQLSGGERQRLSIARELYRDSKLMILDEATSALDSELEAKIDELLVSEQGSKTFVIIAHRLATVRNADLIYVLDEGKVIETGKFDELVAANGEFAKMVKLQSF
jgi:ABC-type multidrug transport system fused ATPase/permease subunit